MTKLPIKNQRIVDLVLLPYNISIKLWKVWTQESFQKVEFDRPIQDYVHPDDQTQPFEIYL